MSIIQTSGLRKIITNIKDRLLPIQTDVSSLSTRVGNLEGINPNTIASHRVTVNLFDTYYPPDVLNHLTFDPNSITGNASMVVDNNKLVARKSGIYVLSIRHFTMVTGASTSSDCWIAMMAIFNSLPSNNSWTSSDFEYMARRGHGGIGTNKLADFDSHETIVRHLNKDEYVTLGFFIGAGVWLSTFYNPEMPLIIPQVDFFCIN